MPKFAFSTVATPSWSIARIAEAAAEWDYDAVELYTEGARAANFANDPMMTAETKTADLFDSAGVLPGAICTSIRYDEPVFPPVVGHVVTDTEASIRQTHEAIQLADRIGAGYVRVLPFEALSAGALESTRQRIVKRLELCATQARGTRVRLAIENAGSFVTAKELASILDDIESPAVVASFSIANAHAAGESPEDSVEILGERLGMVRVSDHAQGEPVTLGTGEVPNADVLRLLADRRWRGLITYDWPRAWNESIAEAEQVLPAAVEQMHRWYHGALAAGRAEA